MAQAAIALCVGRWKDVLHRAIQFPNVPFFPPKTIHGKKGRERKGHGKVKISYKANKFTVLQSKNCMFVCPLNFFFYFLLFFLKTFFLENKNNFCQVSIKLKLVTVHHNA